MGWDLAQPSILARLQPPNQAGPFPIRFHKIDGSDRRCGWSRSDRGTSMVRHRRVWDTSPHVTSWYGMYIGKASIFATSSLRRAFLTLLYLSKRDSTPCTSVNVITMTTQYACRVNAWIFYTNLSTHAYLAHL